MHTQASVLRSVKISEVASVNNEDGLMLRVVASLNWSSYGWSRRYERLGVSVTSFGESSHKGGRDVEV